MHQPRLQADPAVALLVLLEVQLEAQVKRSKPTSCRPLKLTEAEQASLRYWYFYERTAAQKARALNISVKTLYRYIHRKHKPRKALVMSSPADVSRLTERAF